VPLFLLLLLPDRKLSSSIRIGINCFLFSKKKKKKTKVTMDTATDNTPASETLDITLIVAVDEEDGIGNNNKEKGDIPWFGEPYAKWDMKFFRESTASSILIMGSKTRATFGSKPLRGRTNIVISSKHDISPTIITISPTTKEVLVDSFEAAMTYCRDHNTDHKSIFVIGGAQIYSVAMDHVECGAVLMSKIPGKHSCDVKFPRAKLERLYAKQDAIVIASDGPDRSTGTVEKWKRKL
jgi:dihydrofolate reductase